MLPSVVMHHPVRFHIDGDLSAHFDWGPVPNPRIKAKKKELLGLRGKREGSGTSSEYPLTACMSLAL